MGSVPLKTVTSQIAVSEVLAFKVAVMVAVPAFFAVTRPEDETVATVMSLLFHVTAVSSVVSLGDTVAVSVVVSPTFKLAVVLLSVTLVAGITLGVTVTLTVDLIEGLDFNEKVIVAVPSCLPTTIMYVSYCENETTELLLLEMIKALSVAFSG